MELRPILSALLPQSRPARCWWPCRSPSPSRSSSIRCSSSCSGSSRSVAIPGLDVRQHLHGVVRAHRQDFNADAAMREDIDAVARVAGRRRCDDDQRHPAVRRRLIDHVYTEPGREGPGRRTATTSRSTSTASTTLGVKLVEGRNFDRVDRDAPAANSARRSCRGHHHPRHGQGAVSATACRRQDGLRRPRPADPDRRHRRAACTARGSTGTSSTTSCCTRDARQRALRGLPGARQAWRARRRDAARSSRKLSAIDNGRIILKVKSLESSRRPQLCRRPRDGGLPERA